jgi:hypothetical protein|nr:MAG TPA: hypothetical protein [Caudoviricetes sp.]
MIELNVSLASNGTVKLAGYEQMLRFGYTKNRGVYRLAVAASGEWEGLAIRCFWHVPDGKDPPSSLVVDGYVDVPASVTAQPGNGCITFEGSDGTKTVTSADLRYRVAANSGTEDGTEPEPGTPAWQAFVDAVKESATSAEQSKTEALDAAERAGASAQKAEQALSDTITAKEDALKAIGDKQTAATQAVDTARDKALQQVEASTEAAQTAATDAAASAGKADQSAQEASRSLQELKDGIANGDFKGEPGNDGESPVIAVTDIENGHRVSITDKDGTKTIDVLNGQTGKTGATPVLTIGTVSSGDKPSADITGTPENPVLNLRLQPGPQGPAVALDTTLTHEGEAADAKATGDAISAVKARQNILVGAETGNPIAVDDAFSAPMCGLTVYGRSTQDGIPTLDAPVPIVSAGDGGTIAVTLGDGGGKVQTLTLLTPNGLPGIPVTSGGNYTDQSGQQWVCDEVDLERGVKVQRVNAVDLSACAIIGTTNLAVTKRLAIRLPLKAKDYTVKALCNRLPYLVSFTIDTIHFYVDANNVNVFIPIDAKNPEEGEYILFYALATPIETPLTPDEIAAYKALTAYGPDTVVQASDGAGVKLVYQRDVNIAIKRIEDAIASMT